MSRHHAVLLTAVAGTVASLTSAAALAVLAGAEGKAPAQPMNATSHWRHGPAAATVTGVDATHTGLGYATHLAATVFWAAFYERGTRVPGRTLPAAVAVSALAALVDYTVTPKRFTPGWEFVLSRRAMGGAYAAMGLGLYAGARVVGRR